MQWVIPARKTYQQTACLKFSIAISTSKLKEANMLLTKHILQINEYLLLQSNDKKEEPGHME